MLTRFAKHVKSNKWAYLFVAVATIVSAFYFNFYFSEVKSVKTHNSMLLFYFSGLAFFGTILVILIARDKNLLAKISSKAKTIFFSVISIVAFASITICAYLLDVFSKQVAWLISYILTSVVRGEWLVNLYAVSELTFLSFGRYIEGLVCLSCSLVLIFLLKMSVSYIKNNYVISDDEERITLDTSTLVTRVELESQSLRYKRAISFGVTYKPLP